MLISLLGKSSDSWSVRRAIDACRELLRAVFVFSLFLNVLMLTGSIYMLQIYDRVLPSTSGATLFALTLLAAALYAASGCLDFARSVILRHLGHRLERKAGPAVLRGIIAASVALPGRRSDQPLRDLSALRQFISGQAPIAVFDLPWAPFYLVIVFLLHWTLGVVALFATGVLLALAWANRSATETLLAEGNQHAIKSSAMAAAWVRNAEALVAMGMGGALAQRWQASEARAFDALERGGRRANKYSAASRAFRMLAQSLILGVGALLAIDQQITAGTMIAASILLGRALAPIDLTVAQWSAFTSAAQAYSRLRAFFSGQSEVSEAGVELPAPEGRVSVEQLYGAPPGAPRAFLQNISFALEPGQSLGIIGASASGKSTLARHLVGLHAPMNGAVRLDGADITKWNREHLGRHIGYLPQDVEILAGTVAENISRFEEDPASSDIIEAARLARVHEMILRMPQGYETEVGDGGVQLSAGQRQRIALARAVFRKPAFVVLDEPNSNLDAEGDLALQHCMASLKAQKCTLIVVGHRPSTIAQVDLLLVLEEGRARAFGPRADVLAKVLAPANVSPLRVAADGAH